MARLTARLAAFGSAGALALGVLAPVAASAADRPAATPAHPAATPVQAPHRGVAGESEPAKWVAMGDSYTAGAIKAAGQATETPRDGCERKAQSYPNVIAQRLGTRVALTNVSCGNATIANIAEQKQVPIGHHFPELGVTDPGFPFPEVPLQIDAVHADTDVVTVGIGGNSLGFGEIMGKCVELGKPANGGNVGTPCKDYYAAPPVVGIPARLATLAADYDRMLRAIKDKAPNAKVITVGYPFIIPADATTCTYNNLLHFGTITHGDLGWLRTDVLERLNAVIAETSAARGATFVDIYEPGRGHDVCATPADQAWVEGLMAKLLPPEFALVHPNIKGHANAATRVEPVIIAGLEP